MQWRLDERSVLAAVRSAFTELGSGRAVQPVQIVTPFPDGGDVICHQAVLPEAGVYALKMSPYLRSTTDRDGHRVDDARELATNW